jgi:signal peptidase II
VLDNEAVTSADADAASHADPADPGDPADGLRDQADQTDPADRADHADQGSGPVSAAPGKRRRVVLFALVALVALGLDVISKVIVAAKLGDHPPVRLLGGAIYLVETRNSGAAFSVGTGATVVLTLVALGVVTIILRTARRMYSIGWAVALGLILGGALGNIIDRLFREPGVGRGYVVDWISLFSSDGAHFAIFNLADSAITCGAILATLVALLGIELDGTRGPRPPAGGR